MNFKITSESLKTLCRVLEKFFLFLPAPFLESFLQIIKRLTHIFLQLPPLRRWVENRLPSPFALSFFQNFSPGDLVYHQLSLIFETIRMGGRKGNRKKEFESLNRGEKGLLLVPHLGNWELLGQALVDSGFNLGALYLKNRNPWVEIPTLFFRQKTGIRLFDKEKELRQAIKHYQSGGLLGMICDQDGSKDGIFLEFFGRLVSFPKGPSWWYQKWGGAVYIAYGFRDKFESFTFKAVPLVKKNEKLSEVEFQKRLRDKFEEIIKAHPENYLWFYDRWKVRHHKRLVEKNPFKKGDPSKYPSPPPLDNCGEHR